MQLVWISLGGALGTAARHLLSGWALRAFGAGFPYGTIAVNVLGSFLLCALLHVGLSTQLMSPSLRLALTTGAMGGFTTYSTFSYETLRLYQDGAALQAAAYVALTLVGGLAGGALGFAAGRWLVGP
jgi:CrcB protein